MSHVDVNYDSEEEAATVMTSFLNLDDCVGDYVYVRCKVSCTFSQWIERVALLGAQTLTTNDETRVRHLSAQFVGNVLTLTYTNDLGYSIATYTYKGPMPTNLAATRLTRDSPNRTPIVFSEMGRPLPGNYQTYGLDSIVDGFFTRGHDFVF
jgi:hypothetical protein